MRKLAVVVMMFAMAIAVTAALADDHHHEWGLRGTYAMTGTGNYLWAPGGFTNGFSNNAYASHVVMEGIWSFEPNGFGKVKFTQYGLASPPMLGDNTGHSVQASSITWSIAFQYKIENDKIRGWVIDTPGQPYDGEFTSPPGNLGLKVNVDKYSFSGIVSSDHKTITLNTLNEIQIYTLTPTDPYPHKDPWTCAAILNVGRTLIRIDD